jgi:hypothetical protein
LLEFKWNRPLKKIYDWLTSFFPEHVQAFLVSVFVCNVLPLLPLIAEHWVTGHIKEDTWSVTAAMYAAGIGATSRNQIVFVLSFIVAAAMSFAYGLDLAVAASQLHATSQSSPSTEGSHLGAMAVIILVAIVHVAERYGRHVVDRRPFLEFKTI